MTSTIINFIVERYLANILEIDTTQTTASIWSGTVEMSNLKIKPQIFEYSLIHIDKFIHIELFDNFFPRYIVIVEGCNVFKYDTGNKENGVKLINRLFGKLRGRVNESNIL